MRLTEPRVVDADRRATSSTESTLTFWKGFGKHAWWSQCVRAGAETTRRVPGYPRP
ncbi:hypothetical protein [Haloarcula litorea]|uniref:hypothetical protein n=1 Tax=Haloarcula litorea TaxID=3032579 RepID=UPI0023E8B2AE|nr:hypothetical protein [Halomicroarcula sp. GDY20]